MEGEVEWEGRLEVCLGQRWSTVTSDGWTEANSQVVCNDLGYDVDTGMETNPLVCIVYIICISLKRQTILL